MRQLINMMVLRTMGTERNQITENIGNMFAESRLYARLETRKHIILLGTVNIMLICCFMKGKRANKRREMRLKVKRNIHEHCC